MDKVDILNKLKKFKTELYEKYGVVRIGLFGSYAKGTATSESDIDLVIETEIKDFFLREDLREFLQNNFNTAVDVGYLDSFREFYRKKIEDEIIYV